MTLKITLVDGAVIVVPDSLDLITPYVLQEQQDWFEDEIKFLRRMLQPGQKVIDIGANYGVYTLSMAKTVGPTGRVWAFEPASGTARLLADGIYVNGFAQVTLEQSALSNTLGTAQLNLNQNSELNALVHGNPSTSTSEIVPLVTLDECMSRYEWRDIDFMKIDAEGEEANILKGGESFFAELSPLVQYEVKAGADLHMELVQDFAALGYNSYRLVPGLGLLVPFDAKSPPDAYLLNLFCCKPDHAAVLTKRGFMADSPVQLPIAGKNLLRNIRVMDNTHNKYNWRQSIAKFPYGIQLANLWLKTMDQGDSEEVDEALSLYFISKDSNLDATERVRALEASFILLNTLCKLQPSYLRLASLARVARDYGARELAVSALTQLIDIIFQNNQVSVEEPFLAPGERFDGIPPGKSFGDWVLAATLEEIENLASYSSFFTGTSAHQRLEMIRDLGFGSTEMERRLSLLQKRFDFPSDASQ